jgi:hypothetical protein
MIITGFWLGCGAWLAFLLLGWLAPKVVLGCYNVLDFFHKPWGFATQQKVVLGLCLAIGLIAAIVDKTSQPTGAEIAKAKDRATCIKNDPRYDAEINEAFPCER